jgi:hypothetical protein
MNIGKINPTAIYWDKINSETFNGETGFTVVKSQSFGDMKIRQVEYSANYLADHWCEKGHVVFMVSGQLMLEHIDGSVLEMNGGSTYVVGDNTMAHRARSNSGALVLIVD